MYLVPLPLFIAQGSLNSAIFLSKYRSCKRPSCTDPAVTVAAIITWLQSKHNCAFRDLWNCWKTFRSRQLYKQLYRNWKTTLTYPTSRHYYQVRSRTFEPGDLNTFTIAALTLKEHDLIKHKSRKRGEFSTISLRCNTANISRGWWKWIFFKFPWSVRIKGHKKVGGAISFASHYSLKEKYEMVPWKELL